MSENVSIASTKLLPPTTRRLPSKMPLTYIFTVFFFYTYNSYFCKRVIFVWRQVLIQHLGKPSR